MDDDSEGLEDAVQSASDAEESSMSDDDEEEDESDEEDETGGDSCSSGPNADSDGSAVQRSPAAHPAAKPVPGSSGSPPNETLEAKCERLAVELAEAKKTRLGLEEEVNRLSARNEALERLTAAEGREVQRLREALGEEVTPLESARSTSGSAATSAAVVLLPVDGKALDEPNALVAIPPRQLPTPEAIKPNDFALAVVMPKNYDRSLVPHEFKKDKQRFPHRVQFCDNVRQYVIETRRICTVAVQLCVYPGSVLQRKATEHDLPTRGPVYFTFVPCLATTSQQLATTMFKPGTPASFFSPPILPSDKQTMKNGRLSWTFKPQFLSRNTRPVAKGEVFFRIACVNHDIARYNLGVETENVLVVAREQRAKRKHGEE